MGYPGGKSGPGVYHRLINLMPPHPVYCEPFLGGGAVMRLKQPAAYNIGVDLDGEVIAGWRSHTGENAVAVRAARGTAGMPGPADLVRAAEMPGGDGDRKRRREHRSAPAADAGIAVRGSRRVPRVGGGGVAAGRPAIGSSFRFLRGDGLTFLASYPFQPQDLIYCDPPYLMETRSSGRLYRHEMTDEQHRELLAVALSLPCRVMISGYWSELYAEYLSGWNAISFEAMTRGGMATEWLWYNYPDPLELHDYRFLGKGNRERTDLRRQKERWIRRLDQMPPLKKQALLSALATHCGLAAGRSTAGGSGEDL